MDFYYIYSDALTNFNFNASFDNEVTDLKNLPSTNFIQFYFYTIFLIFGDISILILEFISIFYSFFYLFLFNSSEI